MSDDEQKLVFDRQSLGWALSFELGLGVLALLLGRWTEVWPAEHLPWPSLNSVALGALAAAPPLAAMIGLRQTPWTVFRELTDFVDQKLTPMFQELGLLELGLLSCAAGWGEELLFRGLIQAEVTNGTNALVGVLVASVAFGLVHFMTPAYFALAFAISCYFGAMYWYFESLWVPLVSHAAYDFFMLVWLRRRGIADEIEV